MKKMKFLAALLLLFVIGACNNDVLENPTELIKSTEIEYSNDDGCETAFSTWGRNTECFLDLDLDGDLKADFNRWGWTNGPMTAPWNYYYNLYAGAGQCDTDKGTYVGRVYIEYNGSSINVKYVMRGHYTMSEVHFYVGDDKVPTDKKGKYTVAPGKYTYKKELDAASTHEFTLDNINGTPYFISHAVVCGFDTE